MSKNLKPFQSASSEAIIKYFGNENGNKRYLLADEVGLGKTIVAGDVVQKHIKENPSCKVYYICGNQSLIRQNERKLRGDNFSSYPYSDRYFNCRDINNRLSLLFVQNNFKKDYEEYRSVCKALALKMRYGDAFDYDSYKDKNGRMGVRAFLTRSDGKSRKNPDRDIAELYNAIDVLYNQYESHMNRCIRCLKNDKQKFELLIDYYEALPKTLSETLSFAKTRSSEDIKKELTDLSDLLKRQILCKSEREYNKNYAKQNAMIRLEETIIQKCYDISEIYDEIAGKYSCNLCSVTPKTSIDRPQNNSGNKYERFAVGFIIGKYLRTNNQLDNVNLDKLKEWLFKNLGITGRSKDAKWNAIIHGKFVTYLGFLEENIWPGFEDGRYLNRYITDQDAKNIIGMACRAAQKNIISLFTKDISQQNADEIGTFLKNVLQQMAVYSLMQDDKEAKNLVIVDEFQKFAEILEPDEEDGECKNVRQQLLSNKENAVLLLSATPFHYTGSNLQKEASYSSGVDEVDSEIEHILKYVLGQENYGKWVSMMKERQKDIEEGKIDEAIRKTDDLEGFLLTNGVSRVERRTDTSDDIMQDANLSLNYKEDKIILDIDYGTVYHLEKIKRSISSMEELEKCDCTWLIYSKKDRNYYLCDEEAKVFYEAADNLLSEDEMSELIWSINGAIDDYGVEPEETDYIAAHLTIAYDEEIEDAIGVWYDYLEYECGGTSEIIANSCEIDGITEQAGNVKKIIEGLPHLPVTYLKDTPWLLSFADEYKQVKNISKDKNLILSKPDIEEYKEIETCNARYHKLQKTLLGDAESVCSLLFIPPSRPDYRLWGYYKGFDNMAEEPTYYSKTLIFSENKHTPRSFSAMLSYESERHNYDSYCRRYKCHSESYNDRKRSYMLDGKEKVPNAKDTSTRTIIEKEFDRYIGEKKKYKGKYEDIYKDIAKEISDKEKYNDIVNDKNYKSVGEIIFILGSVCGYFIDMFGNIEIAQSNKPDIVELVKKIYSVFETAEAHDILMNMDMGEDAEYIDRIYMYCAQGNIRAVLDEYISMIKDENSASSVQKLIKILNEEYFSVISSRNNNITVKALVDRNDTSKICDASIYLGIADGIIDDGKSVNTASVSNKLVLFNSPFRPFVFTSTSIGAEGLDFHWYCRNIVHWSLEMKPEKMQQKEGRVDRFHCHYVRQNLAADYGEQESWDKIYESARSDYKNSMFEPDWIYCGKGKNKKYACLTRSTYYYPGSREDIEFERVKKNIDIYRALLGKSSLYDKLENVAEDKLKKLYLDLNPMNKEHTGKR